MPTAPHSYTRYQDISETTADLDWAELATIDLGLFDTPGGKHKLASQLKHGIITVGFFYVTNFGLWKSEVDEQFALAQELFSLPHSEKQQHGLVDSLQLYDDPKWNDVYRDRPRPPPLADTSDKCDTVKHPSDMCTSMFCAVC